MTIVIINIKLNYDNSYVLSAYSMKKIMHIPYNDLWLYQIKNMQEDPTTAIFLLSLVLAVLTFLAFFYNPVRRCCEQFI